MAGSGSRKVTRKQKCNKSFDRDTAISLSQHFLYFSYFSICADVRHFNLKQVAAWTKFCFAKTSGIVTGETETVHMVFLKYECFLFCHLYPRFQAFTLNFVSFDNGQISESSLLSTFS